MTQREFGHLMDSIKALSPEQMRQLRHELDSELAHYGPHAGEAGEEAESADQEVQRKLFNAGLLSEIKPPLRDLTPYRDRKAVPIQGEPLSETVIRERR